ncbi:hypothetical protein M9H77_35476 [Catharanthus roseus]|uniref:Uncharacterized protein n=1 Tax=Catharanthus roseus TaxID=4058 RepID=A0ACB9ZQE8_CATRO|nr:hypothetical protein M9H77_35476 [Catharanthus roseus]
MAGFPLPLLCESFNSLIEVLQEEVILGWIWIQFNKHKRIYIKVVSEQPPNKGQTELSYEHNFMIALRAKTLELEMVIMTHLLKEFQENNARNGRNYVSIRRMKAQPIKTWSIMKQSLRNKFGVENHERQRQGQAKEKFMESSMVIFMLSLKESLFRIVNESSFLYAFMKDIDSFIPSIQLWNLVSHQFECCLDEQKVLTVDGFLKAFLLGNIHSFKVLKVHPCDLVKTTFENGVFELALKELDEKLVQAIQDWLISKSAFVEENIHNVTSFYNKFNKELNILASLLVDVPKEKTGFPWQLCVLLVGSAYNQASCSTTLLLSFEIDYGDNLLMQSKSYIQESQAAKDLLNGLSTSTMLKKLKAFENNSMIVYIMEALKRKVDEFELQGKHPMLFTMCSIFCLRCFWRGELGDRLPTAHGSLLEYGSFKSSIEVLQEEVILGRIWIQFNKHKRIHINFPKCS